MNFTVQNIKDLKQLMSDTIKEEVPPIVNQIIDEKIKSLPTKEEFYSKLKKKSR